MICYFMKCLWKSKIIAVNNLTSSSVTIIILVNESAITLGFRSFWVATIWVLDLTFDDIYFFPEISSVHHTALVWPFICWRQASSCTNDWNISIGLIAVLNDYLLNVVLDLLDLLLSFERFKLLSLLLNFFGGEETSDLVNIIVSGIVILTTDFFFGGEVTSDWVNIIVRGIVFLTFDFFNDHLEVFTRSITSSNILRLSCNLIVLLGYLMGGERNNLAFLNWSLKGLLMRDSLINHLSIRYCR